MSSIHVYSSPRATAGPYSRAIIAEEQPGAVPASISSSRDDAYLFQWVEENCNGSQGLVVFNPKILHDSGFFFGVSHTGLSLNITGAYARSLGKFDIMKYFV